MESKRIETYDELVAHYNEQVKRLDEIEELLKQLKFPKTKKLTDYKKQLKQAKENIYEDLDNIENFVTNTCTYDRQTLISFMTRFYSAKLGIDFIPVEIYDSSAGEYASHAFVIISKNDYERLKVKINFDRPINSKKFNKLCKDEFLVLTGPNKCRLMDGMQLDEVYAQFPEIMPVLELAITIRLKNPDLNNRACLNIALDEYITKRLGGNNGDDLSYDPFDENLRSEISKVVQQIMDEKSNSDPVINSMLDMTSHLVKLGDEEKHVGPVPTLEELKAKLSTESENPIKVTMVDEAPVDKKTQYKAASSVLLDMISNMVILDDMPKKDASHEEKVIEVEQVPVEKETQYKAVSSVLLGMIDNMIVLDGEDCKTLGKK